MSWYEGTFSCGHDGCVSIIGPSKDREWKKERAFSGLCPECYKKKQEEKRHQANLRAAEKSSEMDLPALTGSEKQIAWANTLRLKVIESYEEITDAYEKNYERAKSYLEKMEREGTPSEHTLSDLKFYVPGNNGDKLLTSREELSDAVDYILSAKTDASFWIDSRYKTDNFSSFVQEYREYNAKTDIPDEIKEEISIQKEQLTVIPAIEDKKSGVVEIMYMDNGKILSAKYIKHEEFISIIKEFNFKWDGTAWFRKISEYTGAIADRAAELGNRLLTVGYTVQFPDETSKHAAVSGRFEPENDRWVKWNTGENRFEIVWKRRNDTLYGAALKLPGAKWRNGGMAVNVEFYKEVLDFAETMGFSISMTAQEKIRKYMEKENGFDLRQINPAQQTLISDADRLEKSLKAGGTILTDLLDGE